MDVFGDSSASGRQTATALQEADQSFEATLPQIVAMGAAVANYQSLAPTLVVILPFEQGAKSAALALVAITSALGVLFHLYKGGWARAAILCCEPLVGADAMRGFAHIDSSAESVKRRYRSRCDKTTRASVSPCAAWV